MYRFTSVFCGLALAFTFVFSIDAPAAPAGPHPNLITADEKSDSTNQAEKQKTEPLTYGDTILVTASRTEMTVAEAPVSMTIVGSEKIETQGPVNYADALRGVPGLNVIQLSAGSVSLTSRAATAAAPTGELALVDGRTVYLDFVGAVLWDALPIGFDEIKQIEVLRGPGSAVWGANAFNGVVNILTKSPREMKGGEARIGGGEHGTFQAGVRWADAGDKWAYKLSSSYLEQDAWPRDKTLPSGQPLPPAVDFNSRGTKQPKFDARFDYDPDADQHWSFSGGTGVRSGIMYTRLGPFESDSPFYQSYWSAAYARKSLDASLYVNRLDGEMINLVNPIAFDLNSTTVVGDVTNRVSIGSKQVLVYGGTARTILFDVSIAPLADERTEVGAYVEDQVRLNKHVDFNLGGRLDWFSNVKEVFSPRASLILKPHADHALRFAYNRAFLVPPLLANYLDVTMNQTGTLPAPFSTVITFPMRVIGNEDLKEQRVDAFEVGYTVSLARRATLTASFFRNESKGVITSYPSAYYNSQDPPPGWSLPPFLLDVLYLPKLITFRNYGKEIDKGLEFSADIRLYRDLTATASYTYQAEPEVEGDSPTDPLVVNIPARHQVSGTLYGSHGPFFGSFGASYVDKAFWSDVLTARFWGWTDSYTLLSAAAGWRLHGGRYTLAVRATNLADKKVKQHIFGDIIGRTVTTDVSVKF